MMDESVKQIAVTHITRCQAVSMVMDISDETVENRLTILLRHQTHLQGNGLCTLAAGSKLVGFGMVELLDERSLDAVGPRFTHQMVPPVVVGCGHQRHGGVLGKARPPGTIVVPVAKTLSENIA